MLSGGCKSNVSPSPRHRLRRATRILLLVGRSDQRLGRAKAGPGCGGAGRRGPTLTRQTALILLDWSRLSVLAITVKKADRHRCAWEQGRIRRYGHHD